jgi:hypothetical protein
MLFFQADNDRVANVVRNLRGQKFLGRDASRHSASERACALTLTLLLSDSDEISGQRMDYVRPLGVSEPYAADIRAGRRRPYPRHWRKLAELVGVSSPLSLVD